MRVLTQIQGAQNVVGCCLDCIKHGDKENHSKTEEHLVCSIRVDLLCHFFFVVVVVFFILLFLPFIHTSFTSSPDDNVTKYAYNHKRYERTFAVGG